MLVISRRTDEAIVVGDGIEIRILRIGRDAVSVGITARPEIPVHRREIYDRIRAANAAAAVAPGALPAVASALAARLGTDDNDT